MIAAALVLHGPAVVTGRVLLPADVILLMKPWASVARDRFPEFRFAQNQLLGPIFEYYSWRHYARTQIREGRIPLWNPGEMGGNVLLANSQSAVLYPPNVLLYVLPLWLGINLVTLLHCILTGLFMLGFLRILGLRHVAALTGAVAWMLCGTWIVWTEFQTPTAVLCWLPGALWASEIALRSERGVRQRLTGFVMTVAAVAMALVAGHPQFAFYVVLTVSLWMVLRSWATWGARGVAATIVCVVAAFLLAAGTLLPVAEATRINHRDRNAAYADAVKLRLPVAHLTSALLPNVRGNPRDYVRFVDGQPEPGHPYIGPYDFTEYCLYGGIPALILAAMGAIWGWRRQGTAPAALIGLLGLALALGTPIGAVFFHLVPGYAQFHAPARALCMVHFALAALAGMGADALVRMSTANGADDTDRSRGLRTGSAIAALTAALAVLAWPLAASQTPAVLSAEWMAYEAAGIRNAVVFSALTGLLVWLLLGGTDRERAGTRTSATDKRRQARGDRSRAAWAGWALPVVCALDLLVWGWGYNPATDPAILESEPDAASVPRPDAGGRAISFEAADTGIKSLIVPNYNVVLGYREVQGADSVHTRRYHRAMETVVASLSSRDPAFPDGNTVRLPQGHHPLLDLMNVTHATTLGSVEAPSPAYVRESEGYLTVWRNVGAAGPGRVVYHVERAADVADAVRRLSEPGHDPRHVALVEGDLPALDASADGGNSVGTVSLVSFLAHRIEYAVTAPRRGLFVSSEVVYPGWQATVREADGTGDGKPARVYVADGILRAVEVPEGTSRVVFSYNPASFRVGLYITLATTAVLTAICSALYGNRFGKPGSEA